MSDAETNVSPGVDIVIVNWNSGELLADCLRSIETAQAASSLPVRVMVVDNASADASHRRYAGALPVELICNAANEGFARACNQGAARGTAAYILFLNPDTRIEAGVLEKVVRRMEQPDAAKIAVCGIQLVDDKGNVARSCARFLTLGTLFNDTIGTSKYWPNRCPGLMMSDWDHADTRFVDHVMGAFYVIRRSVFERLSGFDEDYYVYYDDLDLSLRVHKLNQASLYYTGARAYHMGGGTTNRVPGRRNFYNWRSRIVYARKHMSGWRSVCVATLAMFIEPVTRSAQHLAKLEPRRLAEVFEAARLLWTWQIFHRNDPRAIIE
jgi:GT2 family glycosyltransferase